MKDILLGISLVVNVITAPFWIPQAEALFSNITHSVQAPAHTHQVSVNLDAN